MTREGAWVGDTNGLPEPPHDLGVGEEECVANDWTWTSYSCGDAADYWRSRVEADAASECTDFFHHHEGPHGERCCTSYPENADDRMCSSMGDDCCACDASIGQYDCEWEEAATCRGGYVPKITYGSDEGRHHHPPCEYSCYHPCTSSEEECWGWLWEMCPAEMDWCHSADPTMDPCWSIIERAANTSVSGGNMTEIEAEIAANELASSVGACVEASSSAESEHMCPGDFWTSPDEGNFLCSTHEGACDVIVHWDEWELEKVATCAEFCDARLHGAACLAAREHGNNGCSDPAVRELDCYSPILDSEVNPAHVQCVCAAMTEAACCMVMTAECLACQHGVSIEEYCAHDPGMPGCFAWTSVVELIGEGKWLVQEILLSEEDWMSPEECGALAAADSRCGACISTWAQGPPWCLTNRNFVVRIRSHALNLTNRIVASVIRIEVPCPRFSLADLIRLFAQQVSDVLVRREGRRSARCETGRNTT